MPMPGCHPRTCSRSPASCHGRRHHHQHPCQRPCQHPGQQARHATCLGGATTGAPVLHAAVACGMAPLVVPMVRPLQGPMVRPLQGPLPSNCGPHKPKFDVPGKLSRGPVAETEVQSGREGRTTAWNSDRRTPSRRRGLMDRITCGPEVLRTCLHLHVTH